MRSMHWVLRCGQNMIRRGVVTGTMIFFAASYSYGDVRGDVTKSFQRETPRLDRSFCAEAEPTFCEVSLYVWNMVNNERASLGLRRLEWSYELAFGAFDWSIAQSEERDISHRGFPEQRREVIDQAFGENQVTVAGENVAYAMIPSHGQAEDPKQVAWKFFTMWKQSPGHYKNMISKDFRKLGVGFVKIPVRKSSVSYSVVWYGTQLFGF